MAGKSEKTAKQQDLARDTQAPGADMTDNMGHAIGDDQNSLRAGPRGPTLMEDFLFREKIHHFDHERIPERVVHARGAAAHGYFELEQSLSKFSSAKVLNEVGAQTPVFVRFSTVAGSRGSADTARDVRGFAVRFYTDQGNWDLVGNNIPVFFIQDAIKFPDLIHAVKPEPHNEIPQAASAHDTFYDFISLTPESMHMMMWIHSDRTIPRGFGMMEGFGVHTFKLINAQNQVHLVKFHWKPSLGVHSLVWDEAQRIAGKDPDFHRRTMWETIDRGGTLEWSLGVQIFSEEDAANWDFDVLDSTKIVPEDLVPVQRVGKLILNRNPENYFAETEQVAYMTTNIVPGIDFSDDPLLQGRNFSYLDTQLSRLGTPNWVEIPINRPLNRVSNNQREGHARHVINSGRVSYEPNTLGGGKPAPVPAERGGFVSDAAPVNGPKLRIRAESFSDHYGQACLFWNSMTPIEKEHITRSFGFELSKVQTRDIRLRMLDHLEKINVVLASQVALALGEPARYKDTAMPGGSADSSAEVALLTKANSSTSASGELRQAKALSIEVDQPRLPKDRTVAILAGDGVSAEQVRAVEQALQAAGASAEVVGTHLGALGDEITAIKTLSNTDAVLFDAILIPGGAESIKQLLQRGEALAFLAQAYKHGKPVAALNEGIELLAASEIGRLMPVTGTVKTKRSSAKAAVEIADAQALASHGIIVGEGADISSTVKNFVDALAQHRFWNRPNLGLVAG